MAYLNFFAGQFIPNGNYITMNGSDPVYVQNADWFEIPSGRYTVVVHSASGQTWEFECNVYDRGTCPAQLSIWLYQAQDGNIDGMDYLVSEILNSAPVLDNMRNAKKLNLNTGKSKAVPENPAQEFTQVKQGGTGWIIFGVVCLLAAFATAETIQSVIACGVLGVICLFVGIKKKKS